MPMSNEKIQTAVLDYLRALSDERQKMHLYGGGAVAELESKLKLYHKKKHALCVSNATMGLLAIAMAAGLKGLDFITTPFTYGATIAGWLHMGNHPIFADIDSETLTLDCDAVRKAITSHTKAILASDIYGIPHDMIGMRKIADDYGLLYISDSAQSLGGSRDGLPAGVLADAMVVSFTAGKTIFAGEGGAILTDDDKLFHKLVWYTQHPMRQKRDIGLQLDNEFALNARIHPLAAVWANAEFETAMKNGKRRQKSCFRVIEAMNKIGLTEKIDFMSRRIAPTFFRLTAAWNENKRCESDLLQALHSHGFQMTIELSPIRLLYRQPAFIAQYSGALRHACQCLQAENQSKKRFCLNEY
jgi:perosamine synthetase